MYLTQAQANDKDLITHLASRVINKKVKSIRALNGRISYNYEVNGNLILKLPSFRTVSEHWVKQSQYLPRLQEKLKYQIPVPTIQFFTLPQGKVMGYFYPKIQGKTFKKSTFGQRSLSQKVAFFEELSQAMEQLHAVPPDHLNFPLRSSIWQTAYFLFKDSPDKQKTFVENIERSFQEKGINLKGNLLCHTDLHSNNVVLDSTHHIVGILDFDNLSMGDSFMEFRPELYEKKDLDLFRQIYQQNTLNPIDMKATRCMEDLYKVFLFMYSLGTFGKNMNMCTKSKTEFISKKEIFKMFKINTDRWSDFGRY